MRGNKRASVRIGAIGAALSMLTALALAAGAQEPAATGAPQTQRPGPPFWRHGFQGPPPIEGLLEHHADELGLDAATQAKIREISSQAREQAQPAVDELRSLHEGMHQLLKSDTPDSQQVMSQADRIGAAETALRKQRLATMLQIRALLTPEQRQKLVQIFEEKRARWQGRFGGSPGGGGPPEPPPSAPPPPA